MLGLIYNDINIKNNIFSTSRLLNSGIAKTVTSWHVNSILPNAEQKIIGWVEKNRVARGTGTTDIFTTVALALSNIR